MKKLTLILSAIAISLSSINSSFASFKDVAATHPNYDAINYVQSKGMVSGYPDGTYKADITINRVEFTKIIVEAMFSDADISACTTSAFKDVPTNEWFTKYVCLAEKNNIIDGYPDGTFQSAKEINLAEASKIIVNAFKYPVQEDTVTWYKPYILKLEELKALPTTLTGFEHLVTRGEMAEEMFRLDAKVTDKASTTYTNLAAGVKGKEFTADEISDKAVIYNDAIVELDNKAIDLYDAYVKIADGTPLGGDFEAVEKARLEAINEIKEIKAEMLSISAFQGDTALLDVFVKDLDSLIDVLMNEEKELIKLWEEMSEVEGDIPQTMIDKEDALIASMNKKADDAYETVNKVQEAFAAKYGYELEPIEENNSGQSIALNEIGSCDKVKTVDFVVDEENLVQYGSFSWTGKIVSAEEDDGTHVRLEVASDNSEAFNFYKERALKSNNEGMNRFVNDKLYFALGSLDAGKLVTSAQDIDDATKLLIEQKVDSGETVTLNFAVKFVEGGGAGNYGVTAACYMDEA